MIHNLLEVTLILPKRMVSQYIDEIEKVHQ